MDRSTQGLLAAGQGNFRLNNNTTSGSKEDVVSRPTAPNTSFSRCPRPVVSTSKPRGSPAASALCSWGEQLSPAQPPPGTAPALHQGHPSQALAPAGRLKSHLLGPHPGLLSQDPCVSGIWPLPQSGTTKQALVALSGWTALLDVRGLPLGPLGTARTQVGIYGKIQSEMAHLQKSLPAPDTFPQSLTDPPSVPQSPPPLTAERPSNRGLFQPQAGTPLRSGPWRLEPGCHPSGLAPSVYQM